MALIFCSYFLSPAFKQDCTFKYQPPEPKPAPAPAPAPEPTPPKPKKWSFKRHFRAWLKVEDEMYQAVSELVAAVTEDNERHCWKYYGWLPRRRPQCGPYGRKWEHGSPVACDLWWWDWETGQHANFQPSFDLRSEPAGRVTHWVAHAASSSLEVEEPEQPVDNIYFDWMLEFGDLDIDSWRPNRDVVEVKREEIAALAPVEPAQTEEYKRWAEIEFYRIKWRDEVDQLRIPYDRRGTVPGRKSTEYMPNYLITTWWRRFFEEGMRKRTELPWDGDDVVMRDA